MRERCHCEGHEGTLHLDGIDHASMSHCLPQRILTNAVKAKTEMKRVVSVTNEVSRLPRESQASLYERSDTYAVRRIAATGAGASWTGRGREGLIQSIHDDEMI